MKNLCIIIATINLIALTYGVAAYNNSIILVSTINWLFGFLGGMYAMLDEQNKKRTNKN